MWKILLVLPLLLFATGCYLPLPMGLRVQIGDGSRACLDMPGQGCLKAEGAYLPGSRLVLTRTASAYTLAHELCHAWQHQNVIDQRGEASSFWNWPWTPQGAALRAIAPAVPSLVEEGADICAHYLLGLPLLPAQALWAEKWLG